jgi:RNA polymerase sigma-70 factor, ECF subfamily
MPSGPPVRQPVRVTDDELVLAITSGDREAFATLVEREALMVYRVCYRVLGSVSDAEDAAQETFVLAYRALATFRSQGSLAGWLRRIATRQALRQAGRRRPTVHLDPSGPGTPFTDAADPARLLMSAQEAQDVRLAVGGLPEPYRETVVLRYFGELTLEEIAHATGRPLGTVKTHLRRGLARLRDSLRASVAT